jgi:hypothetical protein
MVVSEEDEKSVEAWPAGFSAEHRVGGWSWGPEVSRWPSCELLLDAFVQGAILPSREGLRLLVGALAGSFGWHHVLVTGGGLLHQPGWVRTLALWSDGRHGQDFEYGLAESPCATVLSERRVLAHERGVRNAYPQAGWLRALEAESYLGVPLISPTQRLVGHVALLHREAPPAGRVPTAPLRQIARGVAWAIERESSYPRSARGVQFELDEMAYALESTLLHMCAWCRRIREQHGQWEPVEAFFEHRSLVRFSHGICPRCADDQGPR